MTDSEKLFLDLPDPGSAGRFVDQLTEKHPTQAKRLRKDMSLFSDVATLVSYSPLVGSTLLQNPEYIWWLSRKRSEDVVRNKEELLESLARYSLTNSQIETSVLLSRFRRRELIRIFLRDIRRLVTIAEITEEISNLADAILEHALRLAMQDLDNRYGPPMESDEKGRSIRAEACIVSLGKLGSRELNYSSDIDLLFIYSAEGHTAETGQRGSITNREYFIKLAEAIIKLIGQPSGEGAAYRVDMRLRPHGRVGPLAASVADTVRYYKGEAAPWERQVLIRSRSSAGNEHLFSRFFKAVEDVVFSSDISVGEALGHVRESKQKIDIENITSKRQNVKLGIGGIREIEFIAQALQLAHGGKDRWLRSPHTLISLSRLSDRGLLLDGELTELAEAYAFLRQIEHILQMENGLQTHSIPNSAGKRDLLARRMRLGDRAGLETSLALHTGNVNRIFRRVFDDAADESVQQTGSRTPAIFVQNESGRLVSFDHDRIPKGKSEKPDDMARISPRLAALLANDPDIAAGLSIGSDHLPQRDYAAIFRKELQEAADLRSELSILRKVGSRYLFEILAHDVKRDISLGESKLRQTQLAEAAVAVGLEVSKRELERRYGAASDNFDLAVMGLGKLGGGGVDFDSDLDLVMVYEPSSVIGLSPEVPKPGELAQRIVEIFVNVLSSMTRDGSLYRVDLRLRPHGKDGQLAISLNAFSEYMLSASSVWELLAFVKLRSVSGNADLANRTEKDICSIIHKKGREMDPNELAAETRRIRLNLQEQRADVRRSKDIDIKYGAGGMLDIYFATRFLQLKEGLPDRNGERSTASTIRMLRDAEAISKRQFEILADGYDFLSSLDHHLRITVGRATRLPIANKAALEIMTDRMGLASTEELLGLLAVTRGSVRAVFDEITGT